MHIAQWASMTARVELVDLRSRNGNSEFKHSRDVHYSSITSQKNMYDDWPSSESDVTFVNGQYWAQSNQNYVIGSGDASM